MQIPAETQEWASQEMRRLARQGFQGEDTLTYVSATVHYNTENPTACPLDLGRLDGWLMAIGSGEHEMIDCAVCEWVDSEWIQAVNPDGAPY